MSTDNPFQCEEILHCNGKMHMMIGEEHLTLEMSSSTQETLLSAV